MGITCGCHPLARTRLSGQARGVGDRSDAPKNQKRRTRSANSKKQKKKEGGGGESNHRNYANVIVPSCTWD